MPHKKFRRSEQWRQDGKGFLIEVYRSEARNVEEPACFDSEGPHRWCVYAYIYPSHPLFAKIDPKGGMFQDQLAVLGLHAYPSLFRVNIDEVNGKTNSYKVGADYHHLHDTPYTRMATPEEAWTVFRDAQDTFDTLQAMNDDAANKALGIATSGE